MNSITIAVAAFIVVALIHVSYVDFRFRHMDGPLWFWLMSPAPALIWLSRAAIAFALLAALSIKIFGTGVLIAGVIAVLLLIHIGALIALELNQRR